MAQDDYAIVVGISRYADSTLHRLDGPVKDVKLIADWLTSPQRCAVPAANIATIVSNEQAAVAADQELPPVFQDFLDAFLRIVRKPDKSGYIRREQGRLYLYLSGHGFCEKSQRAAHAALYVANADRDVTWNIYGTYFAQWAKDQGLFGEIVLIMDCCRDAELAKLPMVPPLRKPTDVGVSRDVRLFELYAAPRGGKAQERMMASRGNEIHGLLTCAFLEAIDHADPDKSAVSTQAVKDYLEQRWSAICGTEPADPPEVILPSNGEIAFNRPVSALLNQHIRLKQLGDGASFKLIGPDFKEIAQIRLSADHADIDWVDGRKSQAGIEAGEIVLALPATYYMIVAATPAGLLDRKFQAGDPDVEL